MKICPKCSLEHNKSGIFCSRSCANSRTFSKETNIKRSFSNRESSLLFWKSSDSDKERERRKANRKKYFCEICGILIFNKRKTCSDECKNKLKLQKPNPNPNIQSLNLNGILPPVIDYKIPKYGIPGKGATLEKELERIRKITEKAKLNGGGYRRGSGRGKKGWYKGIFCDSSWELAFILKCERDNIPVIRNTEKFPYIFEGKQRNYIPDFIVEGEYVEIKGYITAQTEAKFKQFPAMLRIITGQEMKGIIKEISDLYGKNFISLYENTD